jgi:predicted nucleic-acid-binding protein
LSEQVWLARCVESVGRVFIHEVLGEILYNELEKNKEIKRENLESAIRTLGDKSGLSVYLSSFM